MSKNEKKTENSDSDLGYIGSLISNGFTSGHYPYWKLFLTGIFYDQLGESTLKHISEYVADGYVSGEVIENYQNCIERGWWRLQI